MTNTTKSTGAPKKKILLIVEDEKSMSEILADQFKLEGFSVSVAEDGDVGLQKALKEHPDLILLDILMPHKNGMEMLADLRKDPWGKNVPVVVLSNLSDISTVSSVLGERVFDYLVKADRDIEKIVEYVKNKLDTNEMARV